MTRMLVIGDPHATPAYDNDRFEMIGRFAGIRGVDHVHCVGDWADFPSINRHKSMMEARKGSTYQEDVAAANDALVRFDEGFGKTASDGARKTITLGNHDTYPELWVSSRSPELEDKITWRDVRFREHGWRTYDFPRTHGIAGLNMAHYFSTELGKAQGGIHAAHRHLADSARTCVSGHSHKYDHKTKTLKGGRKVHAFVAGCITHPKYDEPWCAGTVHRWDRGLLVLELGPNGRLDGFEWATYRQVVRETT